MATTNDNHTAFRQVHDDSAARRVVITGATDGMGKVAARELARRGARLLLIGRSRERCEAVQDEIVAETGNQQVDVLVADLSVVEEVRRAAAEIRRRFDRVDTLVNNAGGAFPTRRTVTSEGLELSFALQYLQRYVLTEELLDLLRASSDPCVITVAGGGASYKEDAGIDDLQSERIYGRFRAMAKTGVLNDLLTQEQTQRHGGIAFCNYGPGLVRTKTVIGSTAARVLFGSIGRLFTRSPEQAGSDLAELAAGDREGGFYGPELKRKHPGWAQAAPDVGRPLREATEALLSGLEPSVERPAV